MSSSVGMTFPTEWKNQNVPKHQPEKKGQRHLSHPFQAIDHGVHDQDFHRIFNATQRTQAIRNGIPAIRPPRSVQKGHVCNTSDNTDRFLLAQLAQ